MRIHSTRWRIPSGRSNLANSRCVTGFTPIPLHSCRVFDYFYELRFLAGSYYPIPSLAFSYDFGPIRLFSPFPSKSSLSLNTPFFRCVSHPFFGHFCGKLHTFSDRLPCQEGNTFLTREVLCGEVRQFVQTQLRQDTSKKGEPQLEINRPGHSWPLFLSIPSQSYANPSKTRRSYRILNNPTKSGSFQSFSKLSVQFAPNHIQFCPILATYRPILLLSVQIRPNPLE
jgi:hypothetical protein